MKSVSVNTLNARKGEFMKSVSVFVNAKNLDDCYFQLLSELYKHGRKNHIDSGSFAGSDRLEFDFAAGTIEFPTTRPLAPIMPEGIPPVTTDEKIEEYFTHYLMDGDNLEEHEDYRYSTWIHGGKYKLPYIEYRSNIRCLEDSYHRGGKNTGFIHDTNFYVRVPNQIQWAIDHYKKAGHGNNHGYLQIGYPESSLAYDIPYANETERQTSPCLRGIDTAIKDGVLHMSVTFRSWDLFSGFPENMGGITLLGMFMSNELGIEMGPLSFACLKLHCYSHEIEAMKSRLKV